MIGRAEELVQLRACAEGLAQGGSLVLLEGEAGAGKTRMLEELQPAAVGYCLESARAPYGPMRELFIELDRRSPKILKNSPEQAAPLEPLWDLRAPDAGDPAARRRLLDAAVDLLGKYAQAAPLVIAVEDAHWIDASSAELLAHLSRAVRALPALLAVTYRGEDASQREESRTLVAQLVRTARVCLALRPLSEPDAMLIVNEAAPAALALATRRRICELAQGNPLLLLELTRHAASNPHALDASLPVSVHALIHARLAHFDESERELLRICAALESFDAQTVCEIAGVSHDELYARMHKARAAGLIAEEGTRFIFRHALIRRAIADEILAVQLAELHARIATYLQARPEVPGMIERLAYHTWMARDLPRAAEYNAKAAEAAFASGSFDDAATLFERAIGERDAAEETLDLHYRLAEAYERAGRHRQAAQTYRKITAHVQQGTDADAIARTGTLLSRALFYAIEDDAAIAAIEAAIAACAPLGSPAAAFELHSLLGWYLVHLRRTLEAQRALEAAEAYIAHAQTLPLIRYREARAAYEVHALGGGNWRAETEIALDLADTLEGHERVRRYSNAIALAVASDIEDYRFALELGSRVRTVLEGSPAMEGAAMQHQNTICWIQYVTGRLDEARATIETILPYIHDTTLYLSSLVSVGIPLALRTGDEQLLRSCTRRNVLDEAFASKDPVIFGPIAAAVAEHLLVQGRTSESATLVHNAIDRLESGGNNFDLLLLSARIGSDLAAKRAQTLLEPWVERSATARATFELMQAYLSAGKQRRDRALAAAAIFERIPWPLHQAQALALAGQTDEAIAVYRRVGASGEVARLDLQSAKGKQLEALSKRENEVAELVGQGLSNRAIAEALVLSERTVENHIASIFTKLNLRSRAELAAVVARENSQAV